MLSKKEIIDLYEDKQKTKPSEWDIALAKTVSKWCDIIWRNKLTEFKLEIKKHDLSNKFVGLAYKDVWDLLEKHLIEDKR